MRINVCEDYTLTPGARYRSEGNYSGEEFREEILEPAFVKIQDTDEKIIVDLDGGYGYPTSFLEEVFGGLSRKFGADKVSSHIEIISDDEPLLIKEIMTYIREANSKGRRKENE